MKMIKKYLVVGTSLIFTLSFGLYLSLAIYIGKIADEDTKRISEAILVLGAKSYHLNSIIIVTEPFHTARAALVAKKLGLKYTISPASISPCWQPWKYFSSYFLKEPFAIILYKIENKL